MKTVGPSFQLFDFTAEVALILQSVKRMRECTLNHMVEVYRGHTNKRNKHTAEDQTTPMWARGADVLETDVQRIFHRLVYEGLLEVHIVFNAYVNQDLFYARITPLGETFLKKKKPKVSSPVYFFLSCPPSLFFQFFAYISKKKPKKKEVAPLTVKMTPVTEAQALKEK